MRSKMSEPISCATLAPLPARFSSGMVRKMSEPKCPPGSAFRGTLMVKVKVLVDFGGITTSAGSTLIQEAREKVSSSSVKPILPSSPMAVKLRLSTARRTELVFMFSRRTVFVTVLPGLPEISKLGGETERPF